MSLWQRFTLIFKSKAHKALDSMENTGEMLDHSYERQRQLLAESRAGLAEVATSRKKVELQINTLTADSDRLTAQAQQAIDVGREDLAREALTRKAGITAQIADLTTQHDALLADEEKVIAMIAKLERQVSAFATKKETIKATYKAAEAQTRINEAMSGIGGEFGDIGLQIQRAEERTADMQARGAAVNELVESGALPDFTGNSDDIARELESLSATQSVEDELAALKNGRPAPKELT